MQCINTIYVFNSLFSIFTASQMNLDMVNIETGLPNMKPIWVSWTLDDQYGKQNTLHNNMYIF